MTLFTSLALFDGRVARPKSVAPSGLARAVAVIGNALQASAAARASREMRAFAARCEGLQPQLAAELRAASAHLTTD